MKNLKKNLVIGVVGLGYVGLPLAVEFAKKTKVIGFDISKKRIEQLKRNFDESEETPSFELEKVKIEYTHNPKKLKEANFIVVAIPTPVSRNNQPDLNLVESASQTIGENLTQGATVVFESTVYPGVTEDICVPIIEKQSGLKCGQDWFIGYSPERVNPGDREHTVDKIIKIVSGMNQDTLNYIAEVYGLICKAGVHKAPNIKTAEAAKVFENIQRDVNIALVNELALINHRLDIQTKDVLAAAGTKWNFLKFRPGLVGGHCVGVDPFYLVAKAKMLGYHPQMITAGRKINDSMPFFVAKMIVAEIRNAQKKFAKTKVLVMGLTFKENIRDTRNSKITSTIKRLKSIGMDVYGFDPNLTKQEIEAGFEVKSVSNINARYDAVIVNSPHKQFFKLAKEVEKTKPLVIFDINGIYFDQFEHNTNFKYLML